jgi:Flp pilus assembly protein TadG
VRAPRTLQRGLAAVEMAVIMPVFLLLMLGTAEIGRACYDYNTLIKATRDGARYISARALTGGGIVVLDDADLTAARNLVVTGSPVAGGTPVLKGLATTQVTITESPAGFVTVTVAYPFQPLLAVIPTFGNGGNITTVPTLTAVSVMAAM